MKNLEKLKKKIQEAVPEIMELKIGCEVSIKSMIYIYVADDWKNNRFIHLRKKDKSIFYFDGIKNGVAILGRPITLEDVCAALEKRECLTEVVYKLIIRYWQLNKTLDQQSEETINFLHKILCQIKN